MNKPNGYDAAEAFTGEYEKIEPGAYVCRICKAEIVQSSTGKEMLKLAIDIAEGEHKDFYKKKYEADKQYSKDNAKWRGYYYQLTEGESLGRFKGLIQTLEACNPNFTWDWHEEELKGLKIGMIFGEEEYINRSGKVAVSSKPLYPHELEGLAEANIPPLKKLASNPAQDSFGSEQPDEPIPF